MARIRTIKPEFNTSESVARLSRDSQLFFLKLLTECDDHGRIRWLPKKIAGDLYPLAHDVSAAEIEAWAGELEAEDIFFLYVSDGSTYGCFKNWARHQRVDKPGKSSIPEPLQDGSDRVSIHSRETLANVSRSDLGVVPRKRKGSKERDSATQADASAPAIVPSEGKPTPWSDVETVLKGVSARLETPEPTVSEIKRWLAESSPLRRLIGKFGVPGTVDLAVYAMTHSPGCTWGRIWEGNASYASQLKNGLASFKNGSAKSFAESAQENLDLLQGRTA